MTPKERAAMQQAIEFIVDCEYGKAELALRGALAEQAEQEPVLWGDDKFAPHERPQKPEECANGCPPLQVCDYCQTAEQAEREPVATVVDESEEQTNTMSWILSLPLPVGTKLYAAPVRTKDLTDEEIETIMVEQGDLRTTAFARAVISAYKEKNRG